MVVARRAQRSGTREHEGVEQRAAQGAVMSGGARGAFIYGRGEGAEAVGVGARPTAIDGVVSSGGGNGGRGNRRGGERMGRQRCFGCNGGAREVSRWPEVSRVAALRPVAGGSLGCLTRGGRG
jgi:hypothetical protein